MSVQAGESSFHQIQKWSTKCFFLKFSLRSLLATFSLKICTYVTRNYRTSLTKSLSLSGHITSRSDQTWEHARGNASRRPCCTVILWHPSAHPLGRSQFHHAHLPQIGLHLTQRRATRAAPRHHPPRLVPTGLDVVDRAFRREPRDVFAQMNLALTDYAGDQLHVGPVD